MGSVFKRCTRCPSRSRLSEGEQRCSTCGSKEYSWYYKADVGRDADGKRHQQKRGGFATKREAEQAMRDLQLKLDRDAYVEPSKLTVADFLRDEWLPATRPPRVAETTYRDRKVNVQAYVVPRIGAVPLQDLNAAHLNRMYADLLANGRTRSRGGLSPTTVRNIHVQLHKALEDAIKWGRLERNVTEQADPPSMRAVKARRRAVMTTWTAEQLHRFLAHTRGTRRHALWHLTAFTGMRRSEVLGLRWEDVDLDNGRLAVVNTIVLVEDGEPLDSSHQKTSTSRRTIDLDAGTVALLREHRKTQLKEQLRAGAAWQDTGLVFTTRTGGCLYPNGVTQDLTDAIAGTDLPRLRVHDLRHTHASLLLAAGVNPKVVSERLGHSSVAFTLDTYAHVMPGMQREAAARFQQLIDDADDGAEDPGEVES